MGRAVQGREKRWEGLHMGRENERAREGNVRVRDGEGDEREEGIRMRRARGYFWCETFTVKATYGRRKK